MAKIFKMASETCIFVILVSKLQFLTDFKNLDYIRSVFLFSNFCGFFFSKIQNGGFFEDDVIFEKKLTFFQKGPAYPKLNYFQILKKQSCSKKTKYIPKKFFFPRWRIFSKWRLYFLLATYGIWGKYWFRDEKNVIFNADFQVLGLVMAKKHGLSDKKISACHAPLPCAKFALHPQARP
jgi:hypothetical protein